MKYRDDLTLNEALHDPLIAQVMRADGVSHEDFRRLLETAALRNVSTTPRSSNGFFSGVKNSAASACCAMC